MSTSALYEGWILHRRHEPVAHEFRYRIFLSYLDLDELPGVLDRIPLWSGRRPAAAWFRREDFMGPARVPLRRAVLDAVEERTGTRPDGPVRLLSSVRTFGHLFNPISMYYCFDSSGERVEALADPALIQSACAQASILSKRSHTRSADATPSSWKPYPQYAPQ